MHTGVIFCRLVGLSPTLVTPRDREKHPGERSSLSGLHHLNVRYVASGPHLHAPGPSGGRGCQVLHRARKPQWTPAWPMIAEILFSNGNVVFQLQKEMGKDVCVHICAHA